MGIDTKELARTMISGPIGGVLGARYLARHIGSESVICSDIGGTSFDLALVTDGNYTVKPYPDVARFLLSIPMVQIDSVFAMQSKGSSPRKARMLSSASCGKS